MKINLKLSSKNEAQSSFTSTVFKRVAELRLQKNVFAVKRFMQAKACCTLNAC